MALIDEHSSVPLYTQLVDILRRELAESSLKAGDRLPTVRELAARFGVGKTTVAAAVAELAQEGLVSARPHRGTHVRPRPARGGAPRARTGQIGVVFTEGLDLRNDPFYVAILTGVQRAAAEVGQAVVLMHDYVRRDRASPLATASDRGRVDGFVYVAGRAPDRAMIRRVGAVKLPVVTVDLDDPQLHADAVMIDNIAGARAAMAHLVALGHRRIAYLGVPSPAGASQSARDRYRGYRDGLAAAGIERDERLEQPGRAAMVDGKRAMRRMVDASPTAVFAFCDYLAVGAMSAAEAAGYAVPGDISFVGFGNQSAPWGLERPLTTVVIDSQEMGRTAVELLMGRIDGSEAPPRTTRVGSTLLVRSTTARVRRPEETKRP